MDYKEMTSSNMDKIDQIAMWVYHSPAFIGVFGAMGGAAKLLMKGTPIEKREIWGCVLMSFFIATPTYLILLGLGFSDPLSAGFAIVLSSMGESGYQILINRAKKIMEE